MIRKVTAQVIRAFIALILCSTAIGKALDVPGFVGVIGTYETLPGLLHWPAAIGMIAIEACIAALLIRGGPWLPRGALASAALHTIFIGWAGQALARGLELDNCGCFGVFLARPLGVSTLVEDGVMVGLSLVLFLLTRSSRAPG